MFVVSMETASSRKSKAHVHMNLKIVTIFSRLSHIQTRQNPSTKKGKCTQIPPFSNWLLVRIFWKMKISFLQWSVNEYFNHNLGQAPCLGVVSPNKMDSVFCLYGLFFPFLVLFLYFPISFLFHMFFFSCRAEREKKEERLKELERMWKGARGRSWVDREVERVWKECGRGK